MTDNEIIKALECCVRRHCFTNNSKACLECPAISLCCISNLLTHSLNLINRQKAEIERVKKQVVFETNSAYYRGTKAAFKEFSEAYKDQIENCTGMFTDEGFYIPLDAVLNSIDFIYERLVGEKDES